MRNSIVFKAGLITLILWFNNSEMLNAKATIATAIEKYLDSVALSRSGNTVRTYKNGLASFQVTLKDNDLDPQEVDISKLNENSITWFAKDLKAYSATTERLYLTAVVGFFEYLAAENYSEINLPRLRLLIRQRARRPGQRLPQFPRDSIDKVVEYASTLPYLQPENEQEQLRNLRDCAFLLSLADTGMRVHEACSLRRGDIDWNEFRAIIIGKGDKQAVIRFSKRSISAIREYLQARQTLDGASGKSLSALPVFARHDKGAGKKVKPISTATGRNIVTQRVEESLGKDAIGTITPHSFRHYFVTTILRGSGGNLKLAQELARHQNIAVTQRYAHLSGDELDQSYWEIFDAE